MGSTRADDIVRDADILRLYKQAGRDHWRGLRQLLSYDPDQIQMLYATPHRWTPYFQQAAERRVITSDRRHCDYKHQVLANRNMPPWRVKAPLENGGADGGRSI